MPDLRDVFDDLVRFETLLWNAIDDRLTAESDLSLGSFNALLVIERTDGCRVQDIADAVEITVGGASQAVDRLVARGLCERRPNPRDRRSSVLELTTSGRDRLGRAAAVFDRELAALVGGPLSAAALEQLAAALRTLRAAASPGGTATE